MCHSNIRSIRKNLDCFKMLMDDLQHEFSLLGVTETWLKDDDCALFDTEGYNMLEKHRQNQSGKVFPFIQKTLWNMLYALI